jgi:tripartite ATP-independent transporter DctP family solute receptor
MKTRFALFILAVVLALGLLFVGTEKALSAEKILIRIGSPFKAGHILCDAGEKFKELVEKESGGAMEVQTQFGTASEEQINDWCSQGKIEMQSNGHRAIEIFAPQYFFFNGPYVMKDLDHFMRVWDGALGKNAREQMVKNGNVMYLGIVYRGLRQTTSKKPLYTPADVSGMKLRLPTVKTWIAVWKEMGAEPIPIPLPDLYKSLKEGRADASEGDLTQISSFKLDEVQSHLTITNHLVQTGGVSINKAFFNKLAKGNQDLILKAVKEATNWANDKLKGGETRLLVDLQRKGMQVVIPDAGAFREKGKPAVEALFQKEWPVTTWKEVLAQ